MGEGTQRPEYAPCVGFLDGCACGMCAALMDTIENGEQVDRAADDEGVACVGCGESLRPSPDQRPPRVHGRCHRPKRQNCALCGGFLPDGQVGRCGKCGGEFERG